MQYLVSVIDDAAGLATPEETSATGAFNTRLKAVTSRWPTGIRAGADFSIPTM